METLERRKVSVVSSGKPVGAEVRGVDLTQDLDQATFGAIRDALNEHGVICIRGQNLSPERHIEFTARFGTPEKHILHKQYGLPGYPEILLIGNVKENDRYVGVNDGGLKWHTDLSYKREPTLYSFLYALEVPEKNGRTLGDTLFVNTAHAYETLPEPTQARIKHLKGIHSYTKQFNERMERKRAIGESREDLSKDQLASVPEVRHPIVRTHPVTGRKCLYVNEWFTIGIDGLPQEEGQLLLKELCTHCTREEVVYRHTWQVGDLLIWDNPQTQHLATFEFGPEQRRLMRRTIVQGTQPF
jgi:taurine dioxygenase